MIKIGALIQVLTMCIVHAAAAGRQRHISGHQLV